MTRIVFALTAGAAAMLWSGDLPPRSLGSWIPTAYALIGAPMTPLSVGGVARRTTRRMVVGSAAAHSAAQPAPVVAAPLPPGCTQVIANGQVTTHCP
jgi:hypothetical protein